MRHICTKYTNVRVSPSQEPQDGSEAPPRHEFGNSRQEMIVDDGHRAEPF